MAKPPLSGEWWERTEPPFPPLRPHPNGGRPWVGNHEALTCILFVLRTGNPSEMLPIYETRSSCVSAPRVRFWEFPTQKIDLNAWLWLPVFKHGLTGTSYRI